MKPIIAYALMNIWAGVSLGGNLIAAPAKFQAQTLSLPIALDVGRAQFHWVGVGELALCLLFLITLLFLFKNFQLKWYLTLLPVVIFAIQRLMIMPLLDARTLLVISGGSVDSSTLHLVFITLEILKFTTLVLLGAGFVKWVKAPG